MTHTCIIIDDEQYSINQLTEYIALTPSLTLTKAYTNPLLALKEISEMEQPVDFLFTDIEMPYVDGLKLVKEVSHKVKHLVLVSAHLKYAIDGYDVGAVHFLLKPFCINKFNKIVDFLIYKTPIPRPFIWIKSGLRKENIKILIDEIVVIQGASNYIKLHTKEKTYLQYGTLLAMENQLKDYNHFQRISKSFIISIKHIKKYNKHSLLLTNNTIVNIGSSYKPNIT